jgi:hypothetical protein
MDTDLDPNESDDENGGVPEPKAPAPSPLALPSRPGRALIGWMTLEAGAALLAGGATEGAASGDRVARVETARAGVAGRPPSVDQEDLIEDLPPDLGGVTERLRAQANAAPYFEEGWEIKVVDLPRVCSLQQHVHSEHARDRVAAVEPTDLVSIADVTLPAPTTAPLPMVFDETRNIWMVSGVNPNLRIIGRFQAEAQGMPALGFLIGVLPSFVQVARHHGRYVLRDGYHRCYGLLRRGVTRAPVFFRDIGVGELGLGPGLLTSDVYLGDRPPRLVDFLDDEVSADVEVPATQKMLVIQGLELTPIA